jgi:hypothetical protein
VGCLDTSVQQHPDIHPLLADTEWSIPSTYRAEVFFKSTGAMMDAEPWTDRQETFRPLVSS